MSEACNYQLLYVPLLIHIANNTALLQRGIIVCGSPAEKSPCTVRRGAVPLRISLSDTDKAAIAHVNGNQQLLAALADTAPENSCEAPLSPLLLRCGCLFERNTFFPRESLALAV